MNLKRTAIIGFLGLLGWDYAGAAELAIVGGGNEHGLIGSRFSHLDGLVYEFGMTDEQANALSVWKRSEKFPPVSPRNAVDAAAALLGELKLTDDKWLWELSSVELAPITFTLARSDGIELWQYVITYQRWPNPKPLAWGGAVPEIRFVVLMNGQAIRPRVAKEKP